MTVPKSIPEKGDPGTHWWALGPWDPLIGHWDPKVPAIGPSNRSQQKGPRVAAKGSQGTRGPNDP